MRPVARPERRLSRDEASQYPETALSRYSRDSDAKGELATELTDEEVYLFGLERGFRDLNRGRMYIRVQADRGSQLRRIVRRSLHFLVARAGKLTSGSSPSGAMVSSVM
jgi:hypothetical protein